MDSILWPCAHHRLLLQAILCSCNEQAVIFSKLEWICFKVFAFHPKAWIERFCSQQKLFYRDSHKDDASIQMPVVCEFEKAQSFTWSLLQKLSTKSFFISPFSWWRYMVFNNTNKCVAISLFVFNLLFSAQTLGNISKTGDIHQLRKKKNYT